MNAGGSACRCLVSFSRQSQRRALSTTAPVSAIQPRSSGGSSSKASSSGSQFIGNSQADERSGVISAKYLQNFVNHANSPRQGQQRADVISSTMTEMMSGGSATVEPAGLSAFEQGLSEMDRELRLRTPPPLEDPLLVQFIGLNTKHGHKQRARRLATDTLSLIRIKTNMEPMPIFRRAVELVAPLVSIKQVKVTAMKKESVPVALRERQRIRMGINALLEASDKRSGRKKAERVAAEILSTLLVDDPSKDKDSTSALLAKWKTHTEAVKARSNVPGARTKNARPR